jgi:hypothetical protein
MSGPWEKYANVAVSESGPWDKYAAAQPAAQQAQPGSMARTMAGVKQGLQDVVASTKIGDATTQALGGGALAQGVGQFAAVPERIGRLAGTVGNFIGNAATGTISDLWNAAQLPGYRTIGSAVSKAGQAVGQLPGVSNLSSMMQDNTPESANWRATVGMSNLIGLNPIEAARVGVLPKTIGTDIVDKAIEQGVSKGIKPTVIGKPSMKALDTFYDKANQAIKTIAENKDNISLVNDAGETIARPRNAAEFAQAIDQTKKVIYDKYNTMAKSAGEAGITFDAQPILKKLDEIAQGPEETLPPNDPRLKWSADARKYAYQLKSEISELHDASPEIVQDRIKDLNSSLAGYYAHRTAKAQARIDGSVAAAMREQLDKGITEAAGEGYQDLKNQYGALKSIENEVAKRALVNARKSSKGIFDLTDVFTGGELAAGILTANPALILKGAAGKGIAEAYKKLVNPDRYISNMFDKAYGYQDAVGNVRPQLVGQSSPLTQNIAESMNNAYSTLRNLQRTK